MVKSRSIERSSKSSQVVLSVDPRIDTDLRLPNGESNEESFLRCLPSSSSVAEPYRRKKRYVASYRFIPIKILLARLVAFEVVDRDF